MSTLPQTKIGKIALGTAGILIGGSALWFAMRGVPVDAVQKAISGANFTFITLSLATYLASVALRAMRWHLLLRRGSHQAVKAATAYLGGYAMNNILPARLGEVFRLEYTHRLMDLPRSYCIGSLIFERFLDLLCLAAILAAGITLTQFLPALLDGEFASEIQAAVIAFTILLGGIALMVAWAVLSPRPAFANIACPFRWCGLMKSRWFQRIIDVIRRESATAFAAIRDRERKEWRALSVVSAGIWGLEGVTLALVAHAVGIDAGIGGLAVLLVISALSTLIPTAPGYIGTYQLSFVIALSVVHVVPEAAIAAATIQQFVNIGTATVLGLLSFAFAHPKQRSAS